MRGSTHQTANGLQRTDTRELHMRPAGYLPQVWSCRTYNKKLHWLDEYSVGFIPCKGLSDLTRLSETWGWGF